MLTSDILQLCQAAVEMLLAPFGHVPIQDVENQFKTFLQLLSACTRLSQVSAVFFSAHNVFMAKLLHSLTHAASQYICCVKKISDYWHMKMLFLF